MGWSEDVAIDLVDDLSGEGITTLLIRTPAGLIMAMGSPRREGSRLTVDGAHIQGFGIGANSVGPANLRVLADLVMERLGYDELVIRGAIRTSGAVPGRRPGDLRFARRDRSADRP
ncbi:hypothetical protein [Lichenibacterium dinghuense]|uniref:hypothetical protein n=1 Tax=Lichenibacterium dinghuense TaxID=2895977 RepID=UPI001F334228|nr:hypothetical protein [Lichenibacterium sp. 6Y81]